MRFVQRIVVGAGLGFLSCTNPPPIESAPVVRSASPPVSQPAESPLEIALTIDDLPFAGTLLDGDTLEAATGRILAAFEAEHAPATAFVICGKEASQLDMLKRWQSKGVELGNHTTRHIALDRLAFSEWTEDVGGCGDTLTRITGTKPTWFRYPFLRSGRTSALRDQSKAWLVDHGYTIAPVSIDTSDWVLNQQYVKANEGARLEIGRRFVEHMLRATEHYEEVSRDRFGRRVKHVLLFHANALVADHLSALLQALRGRGARFISLKSALGDPVYALPDDYAGPVGMSWLYRIAPARPDAWTWDDDETKRLEGEGTQ